MKPISARHVGNPSYPDPQTNHGLQPTHRAMRTDASNAGPISLHLEQALRKTLGPDAPQAVLGWIRNRVYLGTDFPWSRIQFSAKSKTTGAVRTLGGTAPKLRSDERVIGSLATPDALLLRAIDRILLDTLDTGFSPHSYAYRGNGITQKHALETFHDLMWRTKNFTFAAKIDIRDFFGSIPHEQILALLAQTAVPRDIVALIQGFLSFASQSSPIGRKKLGLLQGSPISGILANLYLNPLDQLLEQLGIPFIRYADDITLLTNSSADLESAIAQSQQKIAEIGLRINQSKTIRFCTSESDSNFELLGFEFSSDGSYRIRTKSLEKAQARILKLIKGTRSLSEHEPPVRALNKTIHLLNLFFGYEPRGNSNKIPSKYRTPAYRLCKPSRNGRFGWVRYWTHLPYSPDIDRQLQGLTATIQGKLRIVTKAHRSQLRSPVAAYRLLTRKGEKYRPQLTT